MRRKLIPVIESNTVRSLITIDNPEMIMCEWNGKRDLQ